MLRLNNPTYTNENLILESMVDEAIKINGMDFLYIPRKYVAKDVILGEDRLSTYENAYPVICYLESADGFNGQNAFASKFGITIDSQATIVIGKRYWNHQVGRFGETVLPNRPMEGDLIYAPWSKGLFEIMFVDHQAPFYQLGKLYTYKLTIELFRYSSERIDTGITDVDKFEDVHSTDVETNGTAILPFANNEEIRAKSDEFIFNTNNPFGSL